MKKPLFPLNITDLHIHQPWWGSQQVQLVFDCGCFIFLYRNGDSWAYHERHDCPHPPQRWPHGLLSLKQERGRR
jgi:hypothetical protein